MDKDCRFFKIWYDIEEEVYKIKDLNNGYGVFHRLDKQLFLKDEQIFILGNVFMATKVKNLKENNE